MAPGGSSIQVTKLDWQPPRGSPIADLILPEASLIAQGLDPLVAASYYNLTSSPLCRLPDELLLDIMGRVDWVGLQCLRRSSRVFMRLFGAHEFRS
ncbi:hypothetical protein B0T26DRAFT_691765 [Lasiosphaeria miniovina]|uniref:F-box domain-containing protein n=1 Tax=Lasiosphaeria miniovina TaxID=1954250 RepID=A0AA40B333_9PEZI|nr:uncharacterized protein B0T26DRAFT_691765 [Lasiosphaeria miniovina]KAK0726789.1 hypothetical protein B0T26DRAFT_691765 [Lasiosphaeria miniovina]